MKLFELYNQPRQSNVLAAATKLCESVVTLLDEGLNDAGSFDFEPDPKFAGVKGITTDTGTANREAAMAKKKKEHKTVNSAWLKSISSMRQMDDRQAETFKPTLAKFAKSAKAKGIKLTPSPEQVLGLG